MLTGNWLDEQFVPLCNAMNPDCTEEQWVERFDELDRVLTMGMYDTVLEDVVSSWKRGRLLRRVFRALRPITGMYLPQSILAAVDDILRFNNRGAAWFDLRLLAFLNPCVSIDALDEEWLKGYKPEIDFVEAQTMVLRHNPAAPMLYASHGDNFIGATKKSEWARIKIFFDSLTTPPKEIDPMYAEPERPRIEYNAAFDELMGQGNALLVQAFVETFEDSDIEKFAIMAEIAKDGAEFARIAELDEVNDPEEFPEKWFMACVVEDEENMKLTSIVDVFSSMAGFTSSPFYDCFQEVFSDLVWGSGLSQVEAMVQVHRFLATFLRLAQLPSYPSLYERIL